MEVAWHFVYYKHSLDIAAFFVFHCLETLREYFLVVNFSIVVSFKNVFRIKDVAFRIKSVFMDSALNVDGVDSSDIYNVKTQNLARSSRESNIDINAKFFAAFADIYDHLAWLDWRQEGEDLRKK